jgi:LmbE family N-acetylglucosaminyl deacetylase
MPDRLYQRIYLSPHLDDVALSCGGRIYVERQAGLSVLVVTLMAGFPPSEALETPFVAGLHARWGLGAEPNPVAVRRAEDREALAVLNATGLHWEWPDCIYRRHPVTGQSLYATEEALFGAVHPAEEGLVKQIAQRLADLPLAAGGRVYVPLTLGGHVDHRLVRRAADAWGAPKAELVYYEDYPYAEKAEALAVILGDGSWWRAETVSLDRAALAIKTSAVASYRSQISTFFVDSGEMAVRLRTYANTISGGKGWVERYWHRKSFSSVV